MMGIKAICDEGLDFLLERTFADTPGCLSHRYGHVHAVTLNPGLVARIVINEKDYGDMIGSIILFRDKAVLEIHYRNEITGESTDDFLPLDGIWQFSIALKKQPSRNDHHGNEEDDGCN